MTLEGAGKQPVPGVERKVAEEPPQPVTATATATTTVAATPNPHQPLAQIEESQPFVEAAPSGSPLMLLAQLADPRGEAVFTKENAHLARGMNLNGVPIAPIADREFYKSAARVDVGAPPMPEVAGKSPSAGVIMLEPDGRLWLVEPTGHYNGIQHTFPKGGLEEGLDDQRTALKEVMEESGLQARISGFLGDYQTRTTVTRMFIGQRTGGDPGDFHWETQAAKLVTPEDASRLLNRPANQEMLEDLRRMLRGEPLIHAMSVSK